MTQKNVSIVDELDQLLDRECEVLLTADFPAFPSILKKKTDLIDRLAASRSEHGTLERLSHKASRNQSLLDEAMAGLRSAAKLLAELKKSRRTIDTYDYMGKRKTLTPDAKVSVEKKA
jgi:flagellar biosynthesis/type III secretory pathway chaperone